MSHGQTIGKGKAFNGMFTYDGVVDFLPVTKNYLVQDLSGSKSADKVGRAIVALSWTNSDGNRENISLYVSKYNLNGKELLGLSGDKNKYAIAVVSHNQKREFPLRQSADLDYVQSSYLVSVRDVFKDNKSVIDYVKVTSPSGRIILMASPKGGASRDLAICSRNEIEFDSQNLPLTPKFEETDTYGKEKSKFVCTGSKAITFAEKFLNVNETRKPSDIRNVGILRSLDSEGKPYTPTSEDLAKFLSVGRWKVDYHFVDSDTVVSQNTWSLARPMTSEEMMGSNGPDYVMPQYTQETFNKIKNLKNQSGNLLAACPPSNGTYICDPAQSPVPVPLTGGFEFSWSDSQLPVTSLWVSGRLNAEKTSAGDTITWISGDTPWDDQRLVSSSTRSAVVKCTRQSSLDKHCADSVIQNNVEGDYNPLSWMSYSELWARDSEQRSMMRSFNWFQPRGFDNNPF